MNIRNQVTSLKYNGDTVTLVNVYPSMLEELFDFKDGISVEGAGRDLDYGGEAEGYEFSGSAYYGNCHVTKITGPKKPKKEPYVEENRYTRTNFMHKGKEIKNVPPVVECSDELLNELLENGTLKVFYIVFVNYGKSELIKFYAKDEWDVRLRALSIWGCYDAIKTGDKVEELVKDKLFSYSYYFSDKEYVLDWKDI